MTGRLRIGRLLSWALALAALGFVAWMVPVRDRCWDARAPSSTRVSVSRDADGCMLHLKSGVVRIDAAECGALRCEPGVASAFRDAHLGVVAALLGIYGLGTIAWAARWRALLDFAEIDLPLGQVWRLSVEAQAGGILLPGGIGGDAFRIGAVLSKPTRSGAKPPPSLVVASVLLDRAIGLAVVAALAAALGFAFGGLHAGPLAFVLAAIPLGVTVGLAVLRLAPLHDVDWLVRGRFKTTVEPVLAYVRDPRAVRSILVAAGLSVVVAGTQFAVIRGLVEALGGAPSAEKWIYVGTAMAFIVSALPALPGGWGTGDAAFVFFFGMAGLSVGTALAVSLFYRLFWYISGVLGAILHLTRPRGLAPTRANE